MITHTISSNFCKKRFPTTIFLLDSFIKGFYLIKIQQENKAKREIP